MAAVSPCSRKRPSGRAELQLHQEAQSRPPACKRRCREEEEEEETKRRRGVCKENRDPEKVLQRNHRTQNLKREPRRLSGPDETWVQVSRPEVRVALIRKTRIQTAVQTSVQNVALRSARTELVQDLRLKEQTNPGSTELQLDQRRPTQDRQTRITKSTSEVTSRYTAGLESLRGKGGQLKSRSRSMERTETRIRRRRKIHPSVFRGRGQLRLSITPGAGQLDIHIHEARGLMGKSQRSCDSYVKVMVTSDLGHSNRIKTQTILNNKNPKYDQNFILCVSDYLIYDRLLVSVFRRPGDRRCSQLIGCMSFGISSLISSSKLVIGWFYLLGEEFGRSKHLRVTSQRSRPIRSSEDDGPTDCADLRRTPDSAPDMDLNHVTTSSAVLKDPTSHSQTCSQPHILNPLNTDHSSYTNTNQRQGTKDSGCPQQPTVSIVRGKEGFGFTICSDCPVRVQAVDPGGPAHQSGLRQGDSVLQFNGLSVETWKCVDLAHAIRSSSHIVLVVWRGLPELRSGCEALLRPPAHSKTTGRKLLPHPTQSKHGRRRGQGLGVRSSLGAFGSLWRDRKEDREEVEEDENQEVTEYSPRTTTLKGTRVTSSNGDNYIILSPVNPGEQLLQPVYHDGTGTIGRLYQTHPSRGQNLLQDPRPGTLQRSFTSRTSTLPPPPSTTSTSTSSAPPSNYNNYQNCTIVQSHLPCSSYGTYVTLAPKTLIFPVYVQPLDLCSPNRTLLMSEEMILHQADLLPAKVTVLIYSDLMLLTREDEAGRCNVLQSPLYLNTLQLREVSSEPLHIYVLQNSQACCRCLFSLKSFSIEQKVRVSHCLHDNIQLQLVTTETPHCSQLPDLPSDFGLLSLAQSDLLLRPPSTYSSGDPLRPPSPSPYSSSFSFPSSPPPPPFPLSSLSPYTSSSPPPRTISTLPHLLPPPPPSSSRSPVWKERGRAEHEEEKRKKSQEEEVEERQQGEGESASETSEHVGGVGGARVPAQPPPLQHEGGRGGEQ
uniref:Uncharacterized protein n=1 Tax=Anabas testudineus TaxID=64144 RepID=A0A3Q1IR90_ANATE